MIIYKTLDEIKKIDKANEIIIKLYSEVLPKYVKAGISTYELDQITEDFIRSNGAIPGTKGYEIGKPYPAYPASLCTSVKIIEYLQKQLYIRNTYKNRIIEVTEKAREIIAQAVVGNRIGDISAAIQGYVESFGFSLVRDFAGHGVGKSMHEDPMVPNYGKAGTGVKIEDGMVIAIEPMVNEGAYQVRILPDMWTVITKDGKRSAHSEYSVAIVNGKPIKLGTGELGKL
jgi:methionyl aminopeptidase